MLSRENLTEMVKNCAGKGNCEMEIFMKLINFVGSMGGYVVFMPMKSGCDGILSAAKAECTPEEMERLMYLAEANNISVGFVPFEGSDGGLTYTHNELRIGIRMGMTFDEYVYNLAHELAHYFLHYDKGDTVRSEKHAEYEEQADRAAKLLLAALKVGQQGRHED